MNSENDGRTHACKQVSLSRRRNPSVERKHRVAGFPSPLKLSDEAVTARKVERDEASGHGSGCQRSLTRPIMAAAC